MSELAVPNGWQTVLTDLSLILFLIAASALDDADPVATAVAAPVRAAPAAPAPRTEPVAIWRDGPGAPALSAWLASGDPRTRATLLVTFAPGGEAAALDRAADLAKSAGTGHRALRVVIEPGPAAAAQVTLAYDDAR